MKFSEITKITFRMIHTSFAIVLLAIVGIFAFEKNIINFNSYADIYAIIPSNLEFEGDEAIGFFIFSENDGDAVELDVKQILMCDYADGNGFGFVSSQESTIELGPHDHDAATVAREFIELEELQSTQTQTANELRKLVRNDNVSDFLIYNGELPAETSQCIMRLKFSRMTKNFKIEKDLDIVSYPFDYVWYFDPVLHKDYQD